MIRKCVPGNVYLLPRNNSSHKLFLNLSLLVINADDTASQKGMKRKIFRVEKKNIQRSSIIKLFDSGFHTTCSKEDNFIN